MSEYAPIERWPAMLEAVIASRCSLFQKAMVLAEADSTQDVARRMDAQPGDVVTTWRQTSGRGRLGRAWADTRADGIAVTFVLQRGQPERLAVACAVGAALAIERVLKKCVAIKWPNDIVIYGRKMAGVLVEQSEGRAYIGVGLNVNQVAWPAEIAGRAISMRQLGVEVDRIDALCSLVESMDRALQTSDEELISMFRERDSMKGSIATLRNGEKTITGRIAQVDPMRGLEVLMPDGSSMFLPAATTAVIRWDIPAAATSR